MQLPKLFATKKTEAFVDELARDVAKRTQAELWDRVRDEILSMDLPQARGYARARALAPVRAEVEAILGEHGPLPAWAEKRLLGFSLDRAVHRLMTDLVAGGPAGRCIVVVAPAIEVAPVRRAA